MANYYVERAKLQDLEWVEVESSHLDAVAWWEGDLLIRFKNDSIYIYLHVPVEVYQALLAAPSVGEYLDAKIKPIYACMKLDQ